jgi:putative transposase
VRSSSFYYRRSGGRKGALPSTHTVKDIYSRKVLIHMLKHNIRKEDVLVMLLLMLLEHKAEGMCLRNDNGSQFIAQAVRLYLKDKGIYKEFSHVAIPEDNAYI